MRKCFFLILFLNLYCLPVMANDGAEKIKTKIKNFKDGYGLGKQITDNDFYEITGAPDAKISFSDMAALWQEFVNVQNPTIKKSNLIRVLKSNRAAIADLAYKYRYSLQFTNVPGVMEREEFGEYALSKDKVLISLENNKKNSFDFQKYIASYDGRVIRHVDLDVVPPYAPIDYPTEALGEKFYPQHSLLAVSALLDTKQFWGKLDSYYDLIGFLESGGGVVLEEQESIEGEKCYIITNGVYRMYVSSEKNFAVMRKECWFRNTLPGNRTIIHRANLGDFEDYGNSIWLPNECLDESYADTGKVSTKIKNNYSEIQINSGIKNEYFEDIIPEDALVLDSTRGIVYMQNDQASINSLLKDAAKSKRVMIFRYISVTLGLIMIAIWFVLKYREYLNKRAST